MARQIDEMARYRATVRRTRNKKVQSDATLLNAIGLMLELALLFALVIAARSFL